MKQLEGRRILVVGASRGIGQAIAKACSVEGAKVALAARSADKLEIAAKDCGDSAFALTCDVRDESQCEALVQNATERLGGLDGLVYSTGMSIFGRVGELSSDQYRTVFETNVFGAAAVTRAALPHLESAKGHAIYLGSESALYDPTPWRGIGAYIASKRALNSIVRSFQLEYPAVGFTNYVVGATITEFGGEDAEKMGEFVPEWFAKGLVHETILEPIDHGHYVIAILQMPPRVLVDHINVRVRPGA